MTGKIYALIVAGGTGTRMSSIVPKQFLELHGRPILMHTIEAYKKAKPEIEIIVVLPSTQIDQWNKLCLELGFNISHLIIEGGASRGGSVLNGLNIIKEEGFVAIHDGVRPFISKELINRSFEVAYKMGSAVASVDLKDSIRQVTDTGSISVNRSDYKIIQTPQTFKISLIKKAYEKVKSLSQSDDATTAELAGESVQLIEGSYDNIKITTPEDLVIAESIAKRLKL